MHALDERIMRLFFLDAYTGSRADVALLIDAAFPPTAESRPINKRVRAALDATVDSDSDSAVERAERCIRALLALDAMFPGIVLDDHVFEPCGYSVNGLLGAMYLTIHVTPEPAHSFISFEINCPNHSPTAVLDWASATLRPARLALALFADASSGEGGAERRAKRIALDNYRCRASTHYEFYGDSVDALPPSKHSHYDVLYVNFERCEKHDVG
eukprot:TRINITY_DN430_c0_g1_i1.p3 TRINITY_DN430_c0_g1~~TRINITY_DN430_c0_g1_i1.p3  ORF type:complete len:214 (-),score=147.83 TRINITY_DN430_c0_g1_i1:93-734(-)